MNNQSKWLLITVIDRSILTEQFNTYSQARLQMLTELSMYSNIDLSEFTEPEAEVDGWFAYGKYEAYLTDDHGAQYDWRIVEII